MVECQPGSRETAKSRSWNQLMVEHASKSFNQKFPLLFKPFSCEQNSFSFVFLIEFNHREHQTRVQDFLMENPDARKRVQAVPVPPVLIPIPIPVSAPAPLHAPPAECHQKSIIRSSESA